MAEKKDAESSTAKAKVSKPKKVTIKKPVSKPKPKTTAKKPISKVKPKAIKEVVSALAPETVKVRKIRKAQDALSSYENLLKKQDELEAAKKLAKNELRKEFDSFLKKADSVKNKYKKLFGETIESTPRRARKGGARKTTRKGKAKKGYTLEQIESFLSQKDSGGKIKIEGKNVAGIARIKAAYEKSSSKDAKSIFDFLNK
jgi:hypothetical protein